MAKRKTKNIVSTERVLHSLRSRYNPIRNLTPQLLSSQLDSFEAGYLSSAALTFDKIEDRDDILRGVTLKRKKSVSRHGYEILTTEDTPRAERQKEVLEFFYNNLSCSNAVDRNYRGGVSLLVRQMMDAVGKRYAAHEIIWKPTSQGMTAEFLFVPLWFFENTTGRLRYLENVGATAGVDLNEAEWMITASDGLMCACSVAYMYKNMPLKDWVIYSERHGMPGMHGQTSAAEGSTEWNALVTALQNFGVDWSMVTNEGVQIDQVDMTSKGELPYPKLVDRMDRVMSALWRGADLSTLSSGKGDGTGASLQGAETELLEVDDAQMITEILNEQVDKWVIKFTIGDDEALAYIKINTSTKKDTALDLKVDAFLIDNGVPVSQQDLAERYNRSLPDDQENLASPARPPKEEDAVPPLTASSTALANEKSPALIKLSNNVNEALRENAADELAKATAADLQELSERLVYVMELTDPVFRNNALRNLQRELPALLIKINGAPTAAQVLEDAMVSGLINGYAEGAVSRQGAEELEGVPV